MSIKGKRIAMIKHTCSVAEAIINNVQTNMSNPLLMEIGLTHIKAAATFHKGLLQATPAERFNDDGTLKPTPELQPDERRVVTPEYIPREPKNFENEI